MLYHRTACVAADDVLVELIDYCYRKFVRLTGKCENLSEGEYLFPSKGITDIKAAIKPDLEGD